MLRKDSYNTLLPCVTVFSKRVPFFVGAFSPFHVLGSHRYGLDTCTRRKCVLLKVVVTVSRTSSLNSSETCSIEIRVNKPRIRMRHSLNVLTGSSKPHSMPSAFRRFSVSMTNPVICLLETVSASCRVHPFTARRPSPGLRGRRPTAWTCP